MWDTAAINLSPEIYGGHRSGYSEIVKRNRDHYIPNIDSIISRLLQFLAGPMR